MIPVGDASTRLAVLEAMVEALPKLLRSGDLTWTVVVEAGGDVHRPSMTLGLLLDLIRRLEPAGLSPAETRRLEACREGLRQHSGAEGYLEHLRRELHSNLDAWRWFVEACVDEEEGCGADFDLAVERRARLELLRQEASRLGLAIDEARLEPLDAAFERLTASAPARDPVLAAAFPPDRFPWLHRSLRRSP